MNDDVYEAFRALLAMHLSRKDRAEDRPNQSPSDSIFEIGDNKKWWIETLKKAKVKNYRWHDNSPFSTCWRSPQDDSGTRRS
jgi:hypothetical protein